MKISGACIHFKVVKKPGIEVFGQSYLERAVSQSEFLAESLSEQ